MARFVSRCACSLLLGVSVLAALSCGASNSSSPLSAVPLESAPKEAAPKPTPAVDSDTTPTPHSLAAPPLPTTGKATQEARWWAVPRPCPEGAERWGGPPPEQKEVGCKTDKGVNFGMYTRFFDNGKKAEEGEYEKHFAVRIWTKWNDAGVKLTETPYEAGAQQGVETEWYPSGKVKSQRTYVNGKRHGLTTIWDENGHKRSAIEYKEGKQHGPTTYWNEKGEVARTEQWESGKQVK